MRIGNKLRLFPILIMSVFLFIYMYIHLFIYLFIYFVLTFHLHIHSFIHFISIIYFIFISSISILIPLVFLSCEMLLVQNRFLKISTTKQCKHHVLLILQDHATTNLWSIFTHTRSFLVSCGKVRVPLSPRHLLPAALTSSLSLRLPAGGSVSK